MKTNNTSKRKTDKRTICTKTAIKEVLLEMLKETPFSKISVKELCERIDINRTTFYIHYGNTLDVLIEIIDEFLLAEADEKYSKCNVDNSNHHCPYKLCCKIHTDRKYGVVFFNDDLKNIITKYLKEEYSSPLSFELLADIYSVEKDLCKHSLIENRLLIPLVEKMEKNNEQRG